METEASNRATWTVSIPVDQGETATAATGTLTVSVAASVDYTAGADSSVVIPLAIANRAPVLQDPASSELSPPLPQRGQGQAGLHRRPGHGHERGHRLLLPDLRPERNDGGSSPRPKHCSGWKGMGKTS